MIQTSISVHRLNSSNTLSEGSVYELSTFDVTRSNTNFRFTESPHAISFIDLTVFVELDETFEPMPRESFMFRDNKQLMVLSNRTNTNTHLPGLNSCCSF